MYVNATNSFNYYVIQMKVIWYFWWWDFRYIDNPVAHAESWRAVYLYNEADKSIYSFSWHAVIDEVVIGILWLIYSNTFEIWDDGLVHPLSECNKCWWNWYTKKLWVIRIGNTIIKTHVPKKCSCYFASRLQSQVDWYYEWKDTSKFDSESLFTTYILVFHLWIVNTFFNGDNWI